MRRRLPFCILVILVIGGAAAPRVLSAQAPGAAGGGSEVRPYVSVFAGPALDELFTAGVQAGIFDGSRGWIVRGAYSEELEMFGPTPALSVWDVGVLRAARWARGRRYATVAAGVALTGGVHRGRYLGEEGGWFGSSIYERDPFTTVGLVGAAGLSFAPARFLSLGLDLSGNLNPERPYVTAAVQLGVGAFR